MNRTSLQWIPLVLILAAGCKSKTPEDKAKQVIKIGDTQATMKWMANMPGKDTAAPGGKGSYYYFDIRFEKSSGDKPDKEKTMYLDFDMQQDFVLLVKNDSVPAAICQRIMNGRAGSYEYLLAFERKEGANEDVTVFYHDKIFGMGTVAFVYKQEDLKISKP